MVRIELFHTSNSSSLYGSYPIHTDSGIRVQAENITYTRNLSRGKPVIKVLEEMKGQMWVEAGLESSSHGEKRHHACWKAGAEGVFPEPRES